MASPKDRRDRWYKGEIIAEVSKIENDIKQGVELSFPWLSDSTTTKVQRYTVMDAVEQWLDDNYKTTFSFYQDTGC